MKCFVSVFIIIAFVLTAQGSVLADQNKVTAAKEFERGKVLFNDEKFAEAAEAFRKANALRPDWKLLYNIGQCEAAAKMYGVALETFERYLALGGDEIDNERRDKVLAEVKKLRLMVGALEVHAPVGAKVYVDGVLRGELPLKGSLQISAGVEHKVTIHRNGKNLLEKVILVSGGKQTTIRIEDTVSNGSQLKTTSPPAPSKSERQVTSNINKKVKTKRANWMNASGLGLASSGGALLIASIITGTIAVNIGNDLEPECPNGVCYQENWDDNDKRHSLAITTDVLIGIGSAAAVVGGVLFILGRKRKAKEKAIQLTPSGAVWAGRF